MTPKKPPAPRGVSASVHKAAKVTVTWHAVPGAEYYRVYRQPSGTGSEASELVADVTELEFNDRSIPPATAYVYYIRTVAGGVESENSKAAIGARKGARFARVSATGTPNAIVFSGELAIYGYQGESKAVAIIGRYIRDGKNIRIPGAFKILERLEIDHQSAIMRFEYSIEASHWKPEFRTSDYPQFVRLAIYQECCIDEPSDDKLLVVEYELTWKGGRPFVIPGTRRDVVQ